MHFKTCIAFLEQSYYTKKKRLEFLCEFLHLFERGSFPVSYSVVIVGRNKREGRQRFREN